MSYIPGNEIREINNWSRSFVSQMAKEYGWRKRWQSSGGFEYCEQDVADYLTASKHRMESGGRKNLKHIDGYSPDCPICNK